MSFVDTGIIQVMLSEECAFTGLAKFKTRWDLLPEAYWNVIDGQEAKSANLGTKDMRAAEQVVLAGSSYAWPC